MSTSSEKDTKTTNQTDPWAPQAGALTSAFANAGNAYNQSSSAVAPTNFTAQMSPQQIAAFQQMIQQGGSLSTPTTQAATGNALQSSGVGGVQGALSGLASYNPYSATDPGNINASAQKYVDGQDINGQVANSMLPALQQARDVTMPGIEQNAAIGGNTNSTRTGIADGLVQRGLAEQADNLGATLRSAAYTHGLDLASANANAANNSNVGALTAQGAIGNSAAGTGVTAGSQSVATQGALSSEAAAGGAGLTAAQQAILDNAQQKYQSQVQAPYAPLQGLMSIIGTNNWGSNSSGTSDVTSTPSAWDTISGLMSSGGKLVSGIGGGAGIASAMAPFLALSDRRLKEDITRIGTLDNGLPVYTFRYLGEQRVNVGLMAQDVELVNPAAVHDFHGIKLVDYAMACA